MSRKMRITLILIAFILLAIFIIGYYLLAEIKRNNSFTIIDKTTVKSILLVHNHHKSQNDTLLLPRDDKNSIINYWNRSLPIGPCKYIPTYILIVQFNDGSVRTFRINQNTMKENNDYCFKLLCSKKYFDDYFKNKR